MYRNDLKYLQSISTINSSNIIDTVHCLLRLNKIAKAKGCRKDLRDNIYYFKYRAANWLYKKNFCIGAKFVNFESPFICKKCKGSGLFFNSLTLVKKECDLCYGTGKIKKRFLAMKFSIEDINFIWHLPEDITKKYNFKELNPEIIKDHSIEKKEYNFNEIYNSSRNEI